MLFSTIGQGSVFLWMTFAGMLIALLYEFFRLLRCLFGGGIGVSLLMDCAWGMASGGVMAVMLVAANRGELRPYGLLAVLSGFLLCRAAASWPINGLRRMGKWIVDFLSRFRLFNIVFK